MLFANRKTVNVRLLFFLFFFYFLKSVLDTGG